LNSSLTHRVPRPPFFSLSFAFSAAALLNGCAGQVLPSGGPPDTTPPYIVRSYPDSNATRVLPSQIDLEFSEYVERRTVEEALFISPYVGQPEFDWSGTEVTIRFPEKLRENTTYVLTVGTDVTDLPARGGNAMAHAYTLAFSTGDSIDTGRISGRVFDEHPEGVMIFAYSLQDMLPDTLNPGHTRPQYIVQTGKDGSFGLKNIAFGTYRVIAVRDEYHNLLYDREIDQFGVGTEDPVLDGNKPEVRDVWFRMSKEDTTRPFLASVTAIDRRHLLVRFSEPVDTLAFPQAVFSLFDTLSTAAVAIGAQYQNLGNPALAGIETVGPLDSTATYRLVVRGVLDGAGNTLDTNNASSTFSGPSVSDTLKPYPGIRGIADSTRAIWLHPQFAVDFRLPVNLSGVMHGFSLLDTSSNVVPVEVRPRTSAELLVVPLSPLRPLAWYTLRLPLDSVRDSRGTHWRDSLFELHFQTLDTRTLGTIEGTLEGTGGEHPMVLVVKTTDVKPQRTFVSRIDRPGKFLVGDIPEGRYGIEAFEDLEGDGVYRAGVPHPFEPSARFTVYPDTVKVRARWSVEGVQVRFR